MEIKLAENIAEEEEAINQQTKIYIIPCVSYYIQ